MACSQICKCLDCQNCPSETGEMIREQFKKKAKRQAVCQQIICQIVSI